MRRPTRRDVLRLAAAGGALAVTPGTAAAGPMRTRPIPATGEALPVVGLGTWQQFDVPADSPRVADLRKVLRILFEAGGSVIDTSPMYGAAEARLGDLLTNMDAHDTAFLATKVWTRGEAAGIERMERSLDKLETDSVALMQVHNLVDAKTHMATLKAWKAAGRIRYTGITHYTEGALDDLAAFLRRDPPDFLQLGYNMAMRAAADTVLPLAADAGVAVLVNQPYDSGRLFRKVEGRDLPEWARDFCDSWGQFFLKYLLATDGVTAVIPGTDDPEHMRDNAGAGRGRLPDETERRRMRRLVAEL